MSEKKIELKYILENNLHDSVLNSFYLDYNNKCVDLIVFTDFEKHLKIKIEGIKILNFDQRYDFKNREIILDFDVDLSENKLNMFTTSENSCEILFKKITVLEIV